ncbi:MAG TPA: TIGR00730 family Rossman fold protein [Capillimicrobium sp.]|nr:TIGR00730 family Rossman fold protein [Capillimicrobium sp.]
MRELRSVCVYAGSSAGIRPAYRDAAEALGVTIARTGRRLVYGGGDVGLMKVVADAAMDAGGEVIGVIPQTLDEREIGHRGLSELRIVSSMHERKMTMAELSDAFIALPGGVGTVEELVEVLTWTQLGLHEKPCAVLDVEGYYAPLIAFLDHAVAEGFLRFEHRELLLRDDDPGSLLDALEAWEAPTLPKWIDRESA